MNAGLRMTVVTPVLLACACVLAACKPEPCPNDQSCPFAAVDLILACDGGAACKRDGPQIAACTHSPSRPADCPVRLMAGQVITVDLSTLTSGLASRDDLVLRDTSSSPTVGHVDILVDGVLVSDRVPEVCKFGVSSGFVCEDVLRGATTLALRNTKTMQYEFSILARDHDCIRRVSDCAE